MPLETIEIETGPRPDTSVFVLHGLGASGDDFVSLVDELHIGRRRAVRFVFPHAPRRPVTINGGYVMRAWYDVLNVNLTLREDEANLRESQAAIEELLERERERGVESKRTVLVGFSQGCAMALLTGLRHEQPLAGIAGLSGYLPLAFKTHTESSKANRKVPIFLAHGLSDSVVPFAGATASRDVLQMLGYQIEWHEYPMGHTVSAQEIADLDRWMSQVLE